MAYIDIFPAAPLGESTIDLILSEADLERIMSKDGRATFTGDELQVGHGNVGKLVIIRGN